MGLRRRLFNKTREKHGVELGKKMLRKIYGLMMGNGMWSISRNNVLEQLYGELECQVQ